MADRDSPGRSSHRHRAADERRWDRPRDGRSRSPDRDRRRRDDDQDRYDRRRSRSRSPFDRAERRGDGHERGLARSRSRDPDDDPERGRRRRWDSEAADDRDRERRRRGFDGAEASHAAVSAAARGPADSAAASAAASAASAAASAAAPTASGGASATSGGSTGDVAEKRRRKLEAWKLRMAAKAAAALQGDAHKGSPVAAARPPATSPPPPQQQNPGVALPRLASTPAPVASPPSTVTSPPRAAPARASPPARVEAPHLPHQVEASRPSPPAQAAVAPPGLPPRAPAGVSEANGDGASPLGLAPAPRPLGLSAAEAARIEPPAPRVQFDAGAGGGFLAPRRAPPRRIAGGLFGAEAEPRPTARRPVLGPPASGAPPPAAPASAPPPAPPARAAAADDDVDPLDAFMAAAVLPEAQAAVAEAKTAEEVVASEARWDGAERPATPAANGSAASPAQAGDSGGAAACAREAASSVVAGEEGARAEAADAAGTAGRGARPEAQAAGAAAPVADVRMAEASPAASPSRAPVCGATAPPASPARPASPAVAVRPASPAIAIRPSSSFGALPKRPGSALSGGARLASPAPRGGAGARGSRLRRGGYGGEDDDESSSGGEASGEEAGAASEEEDDETWSRKVRAGQKGKGDKLGVVDHSKIDYPPFRRDFYREPDALKALSDEQVAAMRAELDGLRVRGRGVPRPIQRWDQAGLSERVLTALRLRGCESPLPIQAQALPAIMRGRDVLGVAKTGSGKTLAFVLPLLRHARDQRPLARGDGMIGLLLAPTRELVAQIAREAAPLAAAASLRVLAVYGGSDVAKQIKALKRGVEIVSATPGRLIDILVTSGGRVTNLRRVTYFVLDEADRMFDLGFEPQITLIVRNLRPDRQTVMFSATFPRAVESLARALLRDPIEIQVGGRSVVNKDIAQIVEIRPEGERFARLLEILGEWYERGKILIFVNSQDRCDTLFRDLLKHGYPCLSLHGGKDQADRASTISDLRRGVCNVVVATSVAARGLDVRELVLVVNYDVPNHLEEYVHRVGRTGRAGAKGTAITFIAPDEDKYAPDVARALRDAGQAVPADLAALAEGFEAKRKAGTARAHGSGYGGSGFRFDVREEGDVRAAKRAEAARRGGEDAEEQEGDRAAGGAEGGDHAAAEDEPDPEVRPVGAPKAPETKAAAATGAAVAHAPGAAGPPALSAAPAAAAQGATEDGHLENEEEILALPAEQRAAAVEAQKRVRALLDRLAAGAAGGAPPAAPAPGAGAAASAAAAAALAATARINAAAAAGAYARSHQGSTGPLQFETELEINDFPQHARWKVTHRETIDAVEELGAAVFIKGRYYKPGERVPEGERRIYLHILGPSEEIVKRAKAYVKRVLEEGTEKAMRKEVTGSRFTVI